MFSSAFVLSEGGNHHFIGRLPLFYVHHQEPNLREKIPYRLCSCMFASRLPEQGIRAVPRDIILSLFTERQIVESAALETVLLLSLCLEKLTVALLNTNPGPDWNQAAQQGQSDNALRSLWCLLLIHRNWPGLARKCCRLLATGIMIVANRSLVHDVEFLMPQLWLMCTHALCMCGNCISCMFHVREIQLFLL